MSHPPDLLQQPIQNLGLRLPNLFLLRRRPYNTKWTNKALNQHKNYHLQSETCSRFSYQIKTRRLSSILFHQSDCVSSSEGCDEQERQTQQDQQHTFLHGWWTRVSDTYTGLNIMSTSQPQKRKQQHTNSLHHQKDVRGKFNEQHLHKNIRFQHER